MITKGTASSPRSGRRVVRRARPALDQAYDVALSGLPPEVRPLVIRYLDNLREGWEVRSELSTAMTRAGIRWADIDRATQALRSVDHAHASASRPR
jgi:hypothetical protein